MNSSSSRTSLLSLGSLSKPKPLRVIVLGQSGVGKTAMIVRFITKRFIGEYDSNLEKIYTFHTDVDGEAVQFDILDAAEQPSNIQCFGLRSNLRWADVFILIYSVTDKCSFDECNRLRFLINYLRRRRKLGSRDVFDVPVILVGNQTDQVGDRMVTIKEGESRSKELACACFHEISVREEIDEVEEVFYDVFRYWRDYIKTPRIKRSPSDAESKNSPDYESASFSIDTHRSFFTIGHTSCSRTESPDEQSEQPFRNRASTDGKIFARPKKLRYPPPPGPQTGRIERRMSISGRGSNASY